MRLRLNGSHKVIPEFDKVSGNILSSAFQGVSLMGCSAVAMYVNDHL